MKKTVAKIIHNGRYRVVFDDSTKYNPYTIYKEWCEAGTHGVVNHSKKLVAYSDMTSCMYHLAEEVIKH